MNIKTQIKFYIPLIALVIWFCLPAKAEAARYQFIPTGGNLVLGTELQINTATSTDAQGTNLGSWRGTLADDNLQWTASSTTTGINMQLHVDGVELNSSNKMLVQTEVDLDATVPQLKFQICDWVNSTDVNAVADAQCTGGGWRSLNTKNNIGTDVNYTDTASDQLQWHIYNGYWASTSTPGGLSINTPLSNFISGDSNKRVLIRYFSSTNTTSRIDIDFLRVTTLIDSVYWPSGFVNLASSTPTGYYVNAQGVGNSATAQLTMTSSIGSDGIYMSATGTVSQRPGFYLEFKDVRTYAGMNAILVRGEFGCSTTGINVAPYIYNFNSSSWEILTTATIACSATDAFGAWAKGNVTIGNYLSTGASGGTIRIKLEGSANSAIVGVRWDYVGVIVGSVNSDSSQCQITMGTGTATNCQYTRDLDSSTSTPAVFANPAEDESATAGTGETNSVYYTDVDHDTAVEESTSSNIDFPVTLASNMQVAGVHYASRHAAGTPGATALTVQPTLKDYSGLTAAVGGWVLVGATSNSATQVYTDSLTTMTTALYGYQNIPNTFIDTVTNKMNMRLRPTAAGTAATNTTTNWDFAMVSLQWIESNQPTKTFQFLPTGSHLALGSDLNANTATTTSLEGLNLGSWRGTLTDDNAHFSASSTSTGIDMQLIVDNVELNNANKMLIQTEIDNDVNMAMKFQICDWVSSTDVNNVADSNCTGGGWRSLNSKTVTNTDVNFTATAGTALQWHIYNGYWATGTAASLASIDTPLSNFVKDDSTKRVLVRYFSATNSTLQVAIDFLRVTALTDSVYHPGGFANLGSGVASGTYVSTIVVGNTASAQQVVTTADAQYFEVPGTAGSVADFYWSFKNVKTYTGMNTIYVKAEYACHTTGISHRPKIYNFASSTWEDLTTASIACATADATASWAKNNININDYLSTGTSGGEIRVGWRGLSNGTQRLRFDYIYIIVGTTNTDSNQCQITMGTGTATDCANTRTLENSGGTSTFLITAEDESVTAGTGEANSIFAGDTTNTSTVEEAVSTNIDFSVTMPTNATMAGAHYAIVFYPGTNGTGTDLGLTPALKDYAGFNATQAGGWVSIGAAVSVSGSASSTQDSITQLAIGTYGALSNADDYIDTVNNKMNLKLRTTTSGNSAINQVSRWKFAMVSLAWVDLNPPPSSTITVSGIVYGINETTPLVSATPIKLAIDGTTSYNATSTAVTGAFSFSSVTHPSNGNILTVWLNTEGGDQGTLVFDYGSGCSGGNCSGLSIYKNRVLIDSKNGSTLTNTSLAACDNDTGSACSDSDVGFTATTSQLTLTWPANVLRLATTTASFSPGGNLNAVAFNQSDGTFNGGSGQLTFDGSFSVSGGIATSTSGVLRVANDITRSDSGKFNHNNGEVVLLSPWLTTTISGMGTSSTGSFYNLRIDIPDKTVKVSEGENLLVENNFVFSGQPGAINKIMSTVPFSKWFIKLLNNSLFNFAGIADAGCVSGTNNPFLTPEARDMGYNGPCWNFIKLGGGGNAGAPPPPPPDDPLGGGGGGNQQGGGGLGGGGPGGPGGPPPCPPDDLQCQPSGGGGGQEQSGGSEGGGGGGAAP